MRRNINISKQLTYVQRRQLVPRQGTVQTAPRRPYCHNVVVDFPVQLGMAARRNVTGCIVTPKRARSREEATKPIRHMRVSCWRCVGNKQAGVQENRWKPHVATSFLVLCAL